MKNVFKVLSFIFLTFLSIEAKALNEVSFVRPASSSFPMPITLELKEPVPSFGSSSVTVSAGRISDFALILDRSLPKGLYRQARFKLYPPIVPVAEIRLGFLNASGELIIPILGGATPTPTVTPTSTPTAIPTATQTAIQTVDPTISAIHYIYLFGSSTIAMWSSAATDLAPHIVSRRGESGAKLYNLAKVALRYIGSFPAEVFLVYAGSNDLAESKTPSSVLDSFKLLVANVRASRPNLILGYISIIPTATSGRSLIDVVETNDLIRSYCETDGGIVFIDLHSRMILPDGTADRSLISLDNKHLSRAGYRLLGEIVREEVNKL